MVEPDSVDIANAGWSQLSALVAADRSADVRAAGLAWLWVADAVEAQLAVLEDGRRELASRWHSPAGQEYLGRLSDTVRALRDTAAVARHNQRVMDMAADDLEHAQRELAAVAAGPLSEAERDEAARAVVKGLDSRYEQAIADFREVPSPLAVAAGELSRSQGALPRASAAGPTGTPALAGLVRQPVAPAEPGPAAPIRSGVAASGVVPSGVVPSGGAPLEPVGPEAAGLGPVLGGTTPVLGGTAHVRPAPPVVAPAVPGHLGDGFDIAGPLGPDVGPSAGSGSRAGAGTVPGAGVGVAPAIPVGPGQATPGGPRQVAPVGPGQAAPGGPRQVAPVGPGQVSPGGPRQVAPVGPAQGAPGARAQVPSIAPPEARAASTRGPAVPGPAPVVPAPAGQLARGGPPRPASGAVPAASGAAPAMSEAVPQREPQPRPGRMEAATTRYVDGHGNRVTIRRVAGRQPNPEAP
ncbi:MAG TPA: hypothetical protein VFR67_27225 [Pilimelia sp.]|nr:hypothetical protein [Pilimelia sp.]